MISLKGYSLPEYPFNAKALFTRGLISTQRRVFANRGDGYKQVGPRMSSIEENNLIRGMIESGKPCLMGKIGTNDGEALLRYLDIKAPDSKFKKTIDILLGKRGPFWWDNSIRGMLCGTAGAFPPTEMGMEQFCRRFLNDVREMDVFLTWVYGEKRLFDRYCPSAIPMRLGSLTPINIANPWYSALRGKQVLVVHQYTRTIEAQYKKRKLLFRDPDFLPEFNLLTYKPLASFGGRGIPGFENWEDALDKMIKDILSLEFDIALIGAGGYGIPIGAAIKRAGRQAIHTGGATQILFGIKGGRWEKSNIYNEQWIRPFKEDIPPLMENVESGCFV